MLENTIYPLRLLADYGIIQGKGFSKIIWSKNYKMKMTLSFLKKKVCAFSFNGYMVHHKIFIPFQVIISKA